MVLLLTSSAFSHWATPTNTPVARLVTNLKAYVAEHPDDPQGWYILGRVHGLAYVMRSRVVAEWTNRNNNSKLPNIADDSFQNWVDLWKRDHPDQAPTLTERVEHLQEAVRATAKAIELDPKPSHYHLSLASILEEGAVLAEKVDVVPEMSGAEKPSKEAIEKVTGLVEDLANTDHSRRENTKENLRSMLPDIALLLHSHRKDDNEFVRVAVRELLVEYWRNVAIEYYYNAHIRAIKKDIKLTSRPMRGLRVLVSYEAGNAFVRLIKARKSQGKDEEKRLAEVEKNVKELNDKPRPGGITPVIFGINEPSSLHDLLHDDLVVTFDLDGDGIAKQWPWVRPDTGLLVWDPDGTGKITSGRQLFGSVTWWMFFSDGYHALDALDDNRDGELAGEELRGLRVWFDRNSNGHSEQGEVIDLEEANIEAISARAITMDGDSPANPYGLRMTDGRILPTYDWVTKPASVASPEPATHTISQ